MRLSVEQEEEERAELLGRQLEQAKEQVSKEIRDRLQRTFRKLSHVLNDSLDKKMAAKFEQFNGSLLEGQRKLRNKVRRTAAIILYLPCNRRYEQVAAKRAPKLALIRPPLSGGGRADPGPAEAQGVHGGRRGARRPAPLRRRRGRGTRRRRSGPPWGG